MEREIRYCTAEDGVRIAYCVEGEGPPLLWCPLFVESFSLDHLVPSYVEMVGEIGRGRRLIRYDVRGVGLSDRDASDFSNAALVRDLAAVAEAAGLDRFAIWANTMSGPRAITYALENAERVTHLVLFDTFARPQDGLPFEAAKGLAELARVNWKLASQTINGMGPRSLAAASGQRELYDEVSLQFARLYEESTEGRVPASMILEAYSSWGVGELLPHIPVSTLVVHHLHNPIIPISAGRYIASRIPGAKFVALHAAGASALYAPARAEAMPAIREFLPASRESEVKDHERAAFRTILFTDLVGHAEMMSRLGDERGRAVLREHERITRDVLKQFAGTEVKTMGDGFMASFGSVTKAVECAVALQRAFAEREGEPLSVRVGLNAGEPIAEDGDLFGATVILASRIAAKAGGGEILVADTVRGLCSGKGFLFSDRGEFVAKGFEEPVRVYEVRWRDTTAS